MASNAENKALNALLNLLDEPDDAAFAKIRQSILNFGTESISQLEKRLENVFDPTIRERIGEIVTTLRQENLYVDFVNWVNLGSSNLLRGFILVTRAQYPDLDEGTLMTKIEQLKMDIWLELNENLTALENVKVVNHILYGVHHYDGNKTNLTSPESYHINTLIETRSGSPVALGMLYIILAQMLGLPIYGVNLPQHFILAYLTENHLSNPGEEDVLFYINPFNKGAVFTRREIELFVRQMKYKPDRSFYAPCSNHDIVKRLINSLIHSYTQLGHSEKTENLDNLLKAFE
jgi:regulator of sirC expression with transglutaminase-like and TPR domain